MLSSRNISTTHLKRDPHQLLQRTLSQWDGQQDIWVFGYGSLIWRPDFDFSERRDAKVFGWHRALKMWSRINRGTPECPGLVFAMLSGGSCQGAAFRIPQSQVISVLTKLWEREMAMAVYDPRWLTCHTDQGKEKALAFTLSRQSPSYCGVLPAEHYREIFTVSSGIYGTTKDYAVSTFVSLKAMGIHDRALEHVLKMAGALEGASAETENQAISQHMDAM